MILGTKFIIPNKLNINAPNNNNSHNTIDIILNQPFHTALLINYYGYGKEIRIKK